jgi:hypothetical protein
LRTNASDIRARYNMAWVLNHERQYRPALAVIAEALAMDETGEYHERLMKKQGEILARLALRNQQRFLLQANRVSNRAGPTENKTGPVSGPGRETEST